MKVGRFTNVIAAALMCGSGAFAAILAPGGSGGPTDGDGVFTVTLQASQTYTGAVASDGLLVGDLTVGVGTDSITGAEDFLYQFTPSATQPPGPPTGSIMETLSATSFMPDLAVIDTEYLKSAAAVSGGVFAAPTTGSVCGTGGGATCIPGNSSWSPVTVNFDFGATNQINGGDTSPILVIRTLATTASLSGFANAIDGGTLTEAAYQPTPEPALAGLFLVSLFGVGLILARRFGVLQS